MSSFLLFWSDLSPSCRRWGRVGPPSLSTRQMTQIFKKKVRAFMNLPPASLETACEDQNSTFFHLIFLFTPRTPGNTTTDWKRLAEESLASYIRRAEGWGAAPSTARRGVQCGAIDGEEQGAVRRHRRRGAGCGAAPSTARRGVRWRHQPR